MSIRNNCLFVGRLGDSPELSYTANEKPMVKFSLAVSERRPSADGGEWEEQTVWTRFVLFGRMAESFEQIVQKGDLVAISSRYATNKWEDEEGVTQYSHNFIVERWELLTKARANQNSEEEVVWDTDEEETTEIPF